MTNSLLTKVFGTDSEREIRALRPLVAAINDLEPVMHKLSDLGLAAKTREFQKRLAQGSTLDDILPDAFAVVREAGRRALSMRHYDVQLIGGILMHRCRIAEIGAGEGKTLVASPPAYLNALSGKGVHVVTLNDYFAQRDAEWMGRIYRFLGLTVGLIVPDLDADERRKSYSADITYSTSAQLAFDYLRDNMKFNLADCVQRGSNYAIVDGVDSILIDEARAPVIISGEGEESTDKYEQINRVIPMLVRGTVVEGKKPDHRKTTGDYTLDEKNETAELTDEGGRKVEHLLGLGDLTNEYKRLMRHALKAHHFFRRDHEYVVRDGDEGPEVVIVDKSTGRLMEGSKWSEGLHQVIEAKEGVLVHPESRTLASISVQNYFRLYRGLAGMSGNVALLAGEFREVYRLPVITVPRNKPPLLKTFNDFIYRTEDEKWRNAAKVIQECNANGQPVLAGAAAAEKLGTLSAALKKMGIRHNFLNTGSVEESRRIFARAGGIKEVTLCALTAGHGLNIVCGGDPEYMAQEECRRQSLAEVLATSEAPPDAQAWHCYSDGSLNAYRVPIRVWREVYARHEANCQREREEVVRLGGLCVIALDRQWERRLDNRFSDRAGLRGDPGTDRFILSLQDDLLAVFGGARMQNLMLSLGMEEDVPIESGMITGRIRQAQKANEERFFGQRTHMLKYDDVLNKQRQAIYGMRRQLLEGLDQKERVNEMTRKAVDLIVDARCPRNAHPSAWDLTGIQTDMLSQFGASLNQVQMDGLEVTAQVGAAQIKSSLFENARQIYRAKEDLIGADVMRQTERIVMLQVIDNQWKDHLMAMANLQDGINMQSFGTTGMIEEATKGAASLLVGGIAGALVRSNKPLADFREKATGLLDEMMRRIEAETVRYLFALEHTSDIES